MSEGDGCVCVCVCVGEIFGGRGGEGREGLQVSKVGHTMYHCYFKGGNLEFLEKRAVTVPPSLRQAQLCSDSI